MSGSTSALRSHRAHSPDPDDDIRRRTLAEDPCPTCGSEVPWTGLGKPPKYCSDDCVPAPVVGARSTPGADDPVSMPTNGRHQPCAVVGCTEPGTHWRRDERRAVPQSVLVCIDHRAGGDLPPIPPPVIDEVGDALEALVHAALDGIRPAVVAARLRIPIAEVQRVARARGLPLVAGLLRPRPGAAVPAIEDRLQLLDKPVAKVWGDLVQSEQSSEHAHPVTDDEGDLLDDIDDTDEGPIPDPVDASEDAAELTQVTERTPEPVKVTKRDPAPPEVVLDRHAAATAYRNRLLGLLSDGAWHPHRELVDALLDASPNRNAAHVRVASAVQTLASRGLVESRGKRQTLAHRRLPPLAPAVALVHDLALRHPPPSIPASEPAPPRPEGSGALGDRLGRAVAAACRAFLAEWEAT